MSDLNDEFLPRNEQARLAVLRARDIVKRNNQLIHKLKLDENLEAEIEEEYTNDEIFSEEDSYTFDLYKIKSNKGLGELVRDLFRL